MRTASRGRFPPGCSPTSAPTSSRSSGPAAATSRAAGTRCRGALERVRLDEPRKAERRARREGPGARPAIERLVERSDVFLQTSRRAGPSASGWTRRPCAGRPGHRVHGDHRLRHRRALRHKNAYDLVIQGEAGLIAVRAARGACAGRDPACDIGAGSYAALATLARSSPCGDRRGEAGLGLALRRDGRLDRLLPALLVAPGERPADGHAPPLFCPYGPFPAGDGKLFGLAVLSPEHWRSFCVEVVERPDLLDDERYATMEGRVGNRGELEPQIEEVFRARPAAEWLERLEAAGIPCGAVNEVPEVDGASAARAQPARDRDRLARRPDPDDRQPVPLDGDRPASAPCPGSASTRRGAAGDRALERRGARRAGARPGRAGAAPRRSAGVLRARRRRDHGVDAGSESAQRSRASAQVLDAERPSSCGPAAG